MSVFKSFILALHTQIIAILMAMGLNVIGVDPIGWLSAELWVRTLAMILALVPLYLIIALIQGRFLRHITQWPFKAGWVMSIMIGAYVLTFAWTLRDPGVWHYFLVFHLPIGVTFKSVLASEFTFPIQMLLGLSVLTPFLGLKLGYGLDAWLKRKKPNQKNNDRSA